MSTYTDRAVENHHKGCNCAQAVACAFSDKVGYDEETLFKMAEGFGAGMGNRKCACGAISGAIILAGLVSSSGSVENVTKRNTYKLSAQIVDIFEENCKALTCGEIKGIETGTPIVSCDECIIVAAEAAEKILFN